MEGQAGLDGGDDAVGRAGADGHLVVAGLVEGGLEAPVDPAVGRGAILAHVEFEPASRGVVGDATSMSPGRSSVEFHINVRNMYPSSMLFLLTIIVEKGIRPCCKWKPLNPSSLV